jgi:hypothetical protein
LVRKRDKIIEFTRMADTEGRHQEKALDATQKLNEKQRTLHEKDEIKSARMTSFRVLSQLKTFWASFTVGGTSEETQQKRDEDLLLRDLQVLEGQSSMLILPQMMEHKAFSIDAETKLIHSQISRLASLLKEYRYDCNNKWNAEHNGRIPHDFSSTTSSHATARCENGKKEAEYHRDLAKEHSKEPGPVQIDGTSRPQEGDVRIKSSEKAYISEIDTVDRCQEDDSANTFLDSARVADRENIDNKVDE